MPRSRAIRRNSGDALETSAMLVCTLFLVEMIDYFLPQLLLDRFGIVPRTPMGLVGVVASPFLHGNAAHLIANAIPLFILLVVLFSDRSYRPERALVAIWLGSGFGTWLIGRPSIHIGASSIVYGLVAFLIAAGWWMRNWRSVLVALGVFFLYGGIFYGALPREGIISWEGHLCGAIAGVWTARELHRTS